MDAEIIKQVADQVVKNLRKQPPSNSIKFTSYTAPKPPSDFWIKVVTRRLREGETTAKLYHEFLRATPAELVEMLTEPLVTQMIDDLSWVSLQDLQLYANKAGLPILSIQTVYKIIERGLLDYRQSEEGIDQFRVRVAVLKKIKDAEPKTPQDDPVVGLKLRLPQDDPVIG